MKNPKCSLCNPKRKDWQEAGFYGYECLECKIPNKAFIVSENHVGELTTQEYKIFESLCKKYYPHLKSKHLSKNRKTCNHWYEFLI